MPLYLSALHSIPVNKIPYYHDMTMGHYATHVLGPLLGHRPEANGDVEMLRVLLNSQQVFTADTVNRSMHEVIPDGSRLHVMLRIGGPNEARSFPRGDSSDLYPHELARWSD